MKGIRLFLALGIFLATLVILNLSTPNQRTTLAAGNATTPSMLFQDSFQQPDSNAIELQRIEFIRRNDEMSAQDSLLLPPLAMPQGTPDRRPPIRPFPPGPLIPVPRISIKPSYLLCNSLQLQSARRVVWEPVLTSFGATPKELDSYAWALDNAATEVCAGRLDSPMMNRAYGALAKVMGGLEDRAFEKSLLTSNERIELSSALLQAAYDQFQSRCFDGRGNEAELMVGRLPKTPDIGLGLTAQPASAALGRCGPGTGGKVRPGIDTSFAQSEFQACAAKALQNASQDCTDPAGQDRGRPVIEHDSGWQRSPDGDQHRQFRANRPDGSHDNVYQHQKPDGSQLTHTESYDAHNHLIRETYEFRIGGQARSVEVPYDPNMGLPAHSRPSDPAAARRWEADMNRLNSVRQRDWDEYNAAFEAALRVPPPSDRSPRARIPSGRSGPSRQCQAMSISPTGAVGLLRPQSAGGEGSGTRERISGTDLTLRCLCTFGERGAQLANQLAFAMGEPAVHCGNNEWLRRMDCVSNPRGPADQIRPECLAYLRADNQFDTPETTCAAAIQCPEGSHPIVRATACTCSDDGGSIGRRRFGRNCALVRCPIPGTRSSDPAVQACCGAPEGDPGAPPGGPPRPPRPGPVPTPPR
jgi:hypothetical protein